MDREVVEDVGAGDVEAVHEPAPDVVEHPDHRLGRVVGLPGHPLGMGHGHLGAGGGDERGEPDARGEAGGGDGRGDPVDARRELLVGRQPVPDLGLVAVVELEDVEGPVGGPSQVGGDVALGDPVEVVVPGAPAHLVRRRGAGLLGGPDIGRPTGEQRRRVVSRSNDDRVQRPADAGLEHGPTQSRLGPDLDPVGGTAQPDGAVVVTAPDEADEGQLAVVIPQDRDLLGAQVAPGRGLPVGVVHVPEEGQGVDHRGVDVEAERGGVGDRPRLVAVPEQAEREADLGDGEDEGDLVDHRGVVRGVGHRPRDPVPHLVDVHDQAFGPRPVDLVSHQLQPQAQESASPDSFWVLVVVTGDECECPEPWW